MCCLSSIILYTLQYDYHKLAWRAPKAILAMTEEETASPRPPPASSSDDDPPAASVGGDPKYIVDRTVHATLPPHRLSATPSSIDGVPRSVERLHRLHGTSLLLDASTILLLPPPRLRHVLRIVPPVLPPAVADEIGRLERRRGIDSARREGRGGMPSRAIDNRDVRAPLQTPPTTMRRRRLPR